VPPLPVVSGKEAIEVFKKLVGNQNGNKEAISF
jgi:hypothetical protein